MPGSAMIRQSPKCKKFRLMQAKLKVEVIPLATSYLTPSVFK